MGKMQKNNKKYLAKIIKVFCNVLIILMFVLSIIYMLFMKLNPTDAPKFFGYKPYVILTNSMVPTLPVG